MNGILLNLGAERRFLWLWVCPVFNVNSRRPVNLLVGRTLQSSQEGSLTTPATANEQKLDGAVLDRAG